jgi:uncharacterized repeat protein (TIGR01451 family)
VPLAASANPGYSFANWTATAGTLAAPSSASTTITVTAPATVTANFNVNVTINSSPTGLSFTVTGPGCAPGTYSSSQTLGWTPGSSCTVAFSTPQAGPAGTRYAFSQWENSSTNPSRSITAPTTATTYTASFQTQYLLTTQVSPSSVYGSISPATEYVNAGAIVSVGESANLGYAFTGYSGALSGSTSPQNLTVNAPSTVTATFVALPDVAIVKSHGGVNFAQGQLSATYSLAVGNNGPGATSGTVTVTDTLPTGLTLVSMSGTGWTCGAPNAANVCTRSDSLGSGGTYQTITVTVNVAANAAASVTNTATVSAAGDYNLSNNTSNDVTTINPIVNVSSQVSVTQSGFGVNRVTGYWSATLTVKNTGTTQINGPIQVELTNLSSNAAMTNYTGTFNLSPYITVSSGALAAGASATVTISFTNPSNGSITYTPVTVSGIL